METTTTESLLNRSQSLIGKTIIADGWLRDNSGMISGTITEIKPGRFRDMDYIVCVQPKTQFSMDSFTFSARQMETLLADGKLPIANKFLNSGTNARISC